MNTRLRQALIAALLCWWLTATASEPAVIRVHHQSPQRLAELLLAQAPAGAHVAAVDKRLILSGPEAWRERARRLIERLDHPPRTLQISLRQVPARRAPGSEARPFDSSGISLLPGRDARLSTRPERMVVVDEGSPAVIAEGTGRQSAQAWAGPWGWGGAVTSAGPRNSLAVRARLTGDGRVLLTLEAEEGGGTRRVLTTRSGPLGRWMALESRSDGTRLEVRVDPVTPGSPPPP